MHMDLDTYLTTTHLQLQGWCTLEKALDMVSLVNLERPSLCVELGVFGGRSLFPMGIALSEHKCGKIVGIDPWTKLTCIEGSLDDAQVEWWAKVPYEELYQECLGNINNLGLSETVSISRKTASEARHDFADNSIDVLHIDGNHTVEASVRDVLHWLPKVKPGGFIWFDDIDWTSTAVAVLILSITCAKKNSSKTYGLFQKSPLLS